MLTTQKMPQVLQDLLEMDESAAQGEIRRQTRCTPKEAREVHRALVENAVWAVLQFPDLMAQLVGDPPPRYLRKFSDQRPGLLRKLRRGQRLDFLREVMADGELSQFQARDFLSGLERQGENWECLEKLYADVGDDFWSKRPASKEKPEIDSEMVFPPEAFDPNLMLDWLLRNHSRTCVRWVRQLSGAKREDCQEMVDRLEELIFDNHPDPWRLVSRLWPSVLAPLAGMPNPDWLENLEERREELIDLVLNHRSAAATQLVVDTVDCTSIEARRFLRLLGDGEIWEKTLKVFLTGQVFDKPKPKAKIEVKKTPPPQPKAPEPAMIKPPTPIVEPISVAPVTAPPEFKGPAPSTSPWAAEREKEKREAEARRQKDREEAEKSRQAELKQTEAARAREAAQTEASRQSETAASRSPGALAAPGGALGAVTAAVAGPKKLDLNDTDQVLDRLTRLGEACAAKNTSEALFILDELEAAGCNRDYVAASFPALIPWLPDDPWSDHLDQLGKFAPTISKLLKGEANAAQLAEQIVRNSELDEVVSALEKAWKTKTKADMEAAMAQLKKYPHLSAEINKRVPWLSELMDLDQDGTADVLEAYDDPAAYFGDIMRTRFPDLQARLGETRIQKIKEILPELLESMKERNMRGVMRVMSRLRLGPSDVKALLGALKHMHK